MGVFAVTLAFLSGIAFTLGVLYAGIVFGLGKITDKWNKENESYQYPKDKRYSLDSNLPYQYPDVGNKQYEPSPKKTPTPAPPPLAYSDDQDKPLGSGGITSAPSTSFTSGSTPSLPVGYASTPTATPIKKIPIGQTEESRSASLPSLAEKELPRHRRMNSTIDKSDPKLILKEGVVEVKFTREWTKRYILLRKGYVAIYRVDKRDMKTSECIAIIKLEGCNAHLLPSKKGKYPFEISHEKKQRIYCHAGPNGEKITYKFPAKVERCSFRMREKDETDNWVEFVSEAIKDSPPYLKFTTDEVGEDIDKNDGTASDESLSSDESDEASDGEDGERMFDEIKDAVVSVGEKEPEAVAIRDKIEIPPETTKESERVVGKDDNLKINLKSGWISYYFILGNGVLAFYKANDMKELVGSIQLEDCEVVPVKDDEKEKKLQQFTFEIRHPNKKRIFATESSSGRKLTVNPPVWHCCQLRTKTESTRADWINSIQLVINDSKQTSSVPLIPPSVKSQPIGWLNLILARTFKDMAASKVFHNEMMRRMKKKFDTLNRPDFLGPVVCEKIFFGTEMVQLKSIKFATTKDPNELVGEAELSYNGGGGLEINTELFVNWPRDKFASIPVNAVVKLAHLSGRLHFHLPAEIGARFTAFFVKLPECDFTVEMLVGKKQMEVTGLPKFKKFIITTLRRVLRQQLVYPNKISLHIPFPGRKMDLKTETWGSKFRRRTTYNTREAPLAYESTDLIARKFTVGRFFDELFNANNYDAIHEICAKEIQLHGFNPFNEDAKGFDGVREVATELRAAFSNMKLSISDIAIETNNAFVRVKLRGTQDGPLWDSEPTNEELILTALMVLQFNTDLVYEVWTYWDPSSVFAL